MRYSLLDTLRGLSVISMICYHTVWDLVYLFNQPLDWFYSSWSYAWQQSICWSFIFISGFCQTLALHSLRDGLVISACGLIITLVSILFPTGTVIVYGILTFLGLAILLTALLKKGLKSIPPLLGLGIALILFIVTKEINNGYLGFGDWILTDLPAQLYPEKMGWFSSLFGFTARSFISGDYFSILPWFFLFLSGFYLALWMKDKKKMNLLTYGKIPFIDFLGRHALIIYMIHQPLIYGILSLFFS